MACVGSNAVCLNKSPPWARANQFSPSCAPFDGVSTYRNSFTGCLAPKVKSMKPNTYIDPSCAPFDGISTYRSTFLPLPVVRSEKPPWASQAQFSPSCAPFDGVTTYRGDFQGCMAPKVQSMKPNTYLDPSCAPFDGITTHRCDFIPYCMRDCRYAKQKPIKPSDAGKCDVSCAPFDGLSTYRNDFFPRCMKKTESMKPNARPRFSDSPFDGCTTYKNDFMPFHFIDCDGDSMKCNRGFDSPYCHNPCPPPDFCGDCCS